VNWPTLKRGMDDEMDTHKKANPTKVQTLFNLVVSFCFQECKKLKGKTFKPLDCHHTVDSSDGSY